MELVIVTAVQCPHCWETFEIEVDTSEGGHETVEDCSVCCRPMNIAVECEPGTIHSLEASV